MKGLIDYESKKSRNHRDEILDFGVRVAPGPFQGMHRLGFTNK